PGLRHAAGGAAHLDRADRNEHASDQPPATDDRARRNPPGGGARRPPPGARLSGPFVSRQIHEVVATHGAIRTHPGESAQAAVTDPHAAAPAARDFGDFCAVHFTFFRRLTIHVLPGDSRLFRRSRCAARAPLPPSGKAFASDTPRWPWGHRRRI